jgi:hypothetical protein
MSGEKLTENEPASINFLVYKGYVSISFFMSTVGE